MYVWLIAQFVLHLVSVRKISRAQFEWWQEILCHDHRMSAETSRKWAMWCTLSPGHVCTCIDLPVLVGGGRESGVDYQCWTRMRSLPLGWTFSKPSGPCKTCWPSDVAALLKCWGGVYSRLGRIMASPSDPVCHPGRCGFSSGCLASCCKLWLLVKQFRQLWMHSTYPYIYCILRALTWDFF